MARKVITVFGGSGFVGRALIRKLAKDGWLVRVAVRDPIKAEYLRTMGDVGQINPIRVDIRDAQAVAGAVAGTQAVVNLVGILAEGCGRNFQTIHAGAAGIAARAARDAGVTQYVHMSALGASKTSTARYARSKAEGEAAVTAACPNAVILRPSVIFGADDDFFHRFAKMAAIAPALPVFTRDGPKISCSNSGIHVDLYGSGGPVFQPVWVEDVAEAVMRAIKDPTCAGKIYELGGPQRYSLREILGLVLSATGKCRVLLPVPFWAARLLARVLQLVPGKPLTLDQVRLMETDNVVRGGKPGLAELGITATSVNDVVPAYLTRYRGQSVTAPK